MRALSDHDLFRLLEDDVPSGDLTTDTLRIGGQAGRIEFRARQAMTVCAIEEAARLFELVGAQAEVLVASGSPVAAHAPILRAAGTAAALHRAWKAAQILVEWASGIASSAAAIVAAAGDVPVACTRKNAPGTKALSVKAVHAGGATMHRLGLSETLLIFAEHRLFLDETPAETVAHLRRRLPEKKIIVEVRSVAEARVWAAAGADVLQLEKFSPAQVAESRAAMQCPAWGTTDFPKLLLAAAGGINVSNAAAYVQAGADLLVTSAPYAAPPRDVHVLFSDAMKNGEQLMADLLARPGEAAALADPARPVLASIVVGRSLGEGALPHALGLDAERFADFWQRYFPGSQLILLEGHHEEIPELDDIEHLLLDYRAGLRDSEVWLARMVAYGCAGRDHLWQDLGLANRSELSLLMETGFPALAALNTGDMKWKKFIYRQYCARDGIYVCPAPSCGVCIDYAKCFAPEE